MSARQVTVRRAITPNKAKIYSANLLNVTAIDATSMTVKKSMLGLNTINLQSLISNPSGALQSFLAAPVRGLGMAKIAATNDYALATCMITGTVMRIVPPKDSREPARNRPSVMSSAPVSRIAAESMNSTPTMATAGFANPLKVSRGVRMPTPRPVRSRVSSASRTAA